MKKVSYLVFLVFLISCKQEQSPPHFSGEPQAVEQAKKMFEAIGGLDRWAEIKGLYIKAQHTEPNIENPYQSEIWRDMENFYLVIEQQNEDFHVKGVFNNEGGKVYYMDKDSSRTLTDEQLNSWKFSNAHNVYNVWKSIARNAGTEVKSGEDNKLEFYQKEQLLAAFKLDSLNRPSYFYQVNQDTSVLSESHFRIWKTSNGITHPAGGGPSDGNFVYETEIWEVLEKPVSEIISSSD